MALSKKWQLSPLEYKIDFLVAPILFGAALSLAPISIYQIIAGLLFWSFSEYAVHRFSFHRHFRKDHWAHHLDPTAYIGISGIALGVAYGFLLLPAWWMGLESLYAGFILGYFSYVTIHYAIHHKKFLFSSLIKSLAQNHEMHHQRGNEKNFGVTSPLWDILFMTYIKPAKKSQR